MKKINFNEGWTWIHNGEKTVVDLPHDAMLYEKRHKGGTTRSGGAYFDGGDYTYLKTFIAQLEDMDKTILLEVEGAMKTSKVYVNDTFMHENRYGYTGYTLDISDAIVEGSNTIRIECYNSLQPASRWYSGSGLYRDVNLYIGSKSHFLMDEIQIETKSIDPIVFSYQAKSTDMRKECHIKIYDGKTLLASSIGYSGTLSFNGDSWSDISPKLYKIEFELFDCDTLIDSYSFSYGFRTLEFTTKGFFVNGKRTILKGCCLHHDNGVIGARSHIDSELHKLRILKNSGYNAIRSSHMPASKALIKACDMLGFYLMDEYSDMWYYGKNPYDYHLDFEKNYIYDITKMVLKDRIHPSVILYSLGNELGEPSEGEKGLVYLREMVDLIHSLDSERKTTMGINFTNLLRPELDEHKRRCHMHEFYSNSPTICDIFNEVANAKGEEMADIACAVDSERVSKEAFEILDIAGFNYAWKKYIQDQELHPERITVGTETMCHDVVQNYHLMQKYPNIIGDFMWTGIDYLGEVGIGGYYDCFPYFEKPYPWILANGGAFDLLGYPTGEAFLAMIAYGAGTLYLATHMPKEGEIESAWRWTNTRPTYSYPADSTGKEVVCEVFSVYEKVELFLNGKSLGVKAIENGYARYTFLYQPGELKATGWDKNHQEDRVLKSAKESHITIRKEYLGEYKYFYIEAKDENGILDTTRCDLVSIELDGAKLIGFGSANPITEDSYVSKECHLFMGACLAVLKKSSEDAKMIVKVDSETKEVVF